MKDDDLTQKIIGCASAVHNTLGPGFLEPLQNDVEVANAQNEIRGARILKAGTRGMSIDVFVIDEFDANGGTGDAQRDKA